MAKIIHILPHNIEDFMSGDYNNFDHHSTRFLVKVAHFWHQKYPEIPLQQELWTISKKVKKNEEIQHKNGFIVKLFPLSLKLPLPLELSFPLMRAVFQQAKKTTNIWHLHSYYLWMNDFLGLILKIKKREFFVHFRGGGFSKTARGFLYSFFHYLIGLRFSLSLAKLAFIQNYDEIKRIKTWRLINPSKIIYFPNSVPLSGIKPKNAWGFLETHKLKTITAGRVIKITYRSENLETISKLLKKFPNFNLEIIGLKNSNPVLEKIKNDYPHQLTLTTWVDQKILLEKLKSADLLLFLTEREGSPMTLIEAQAQGLPVISFNVEGVRDIIQDGMNGYLINSINDLDKRLETLFSNPLLIKKMSQQATQKIQNNFNDEFYFSQLVTFYNQTN
ncbi:MAG: glycosyltransferase [Candidatus Gribaldobacteria bacterium]|nr:glycosyltransferase [Candidatus Gribaldobacteria bacterium]